jgi:hypothetical protein
MKTEKYPLGVLLRRKAAILYIVIAARERGMIFRGNNVYAVISCLYCCYFFPCHIHNGIAAQDNFQ